ncbi:MAG TPA: hypothetical protein VNI02_21800 [Blastocatellia bacterium]|jgi:hypothetical protein|nr:hypothetical protein [Blastocatellia bacterium]
MTIQQALEANVKIEPGPKVNTFSGWCRRDKVLVDGYEIGRIQTRRAKGRTEILTIKNNLYIIGYDVDWLIQQEGEDYGANSSAA